MDQWQYSANLLAILEGLWASNWTTVSEMGSKLHLSKWAGQLYIPVIQFEYWRHVCDGLVQQSSYPQDHTTYWSSSSGSCRSGSCSPRRQKKTSNHKWTNRIGIWLDKVKIFVSNCHDAGRSRGRGGRRRWRREAAGRWLRGEDVRHASKRYVRWHYHNFAVREPSRESGDDKLQPSVRALRSRATGSEKWDRIQNDLELGYI